MKNEMIWVFGCIIGVIAFFILALSSCKTPPIKPALYQAELTACVEKAKIRDEADDCMSEVRKRYGRLDAGVHDAR